MLPIHILGTGAMACLWASYFDNHHQINFIRRANSDQAFTFTLKPSNQVIKGNAYTSQTLSTPIEHLIVATKAFDALKAVQSIQHLLAPHAQIVLLQNGMGSQQVIADTFNNYSVYACSSTEGAYKVNADTLMHAGKGTNSIGPMNTNALKSNLEKWLPKNHFQWHEDISPILWRKLIINCAINPLTLIYNCKNGELIKQTSRKQHMQKICLELDLLLEKLPINLSPSFELALEVCQQTANNFSSMYQDGKHKNPTEIDFITGYVVNKCQNLSVSCPENTKLLQMIKKLNLGP